MFDTLKFISVKWVNLYPVLLLTVRVQPQNDEKILSNPDEMDH